MPEFFFNKAAVQTIESLTCVYSASLLNFVKLQLV